MSWPMCKADFKKHHAADQTVFFSHTQKGPCFLCGEPGYFVMRWPDLGRLVKKDAWPSRSTVAVEQAERLGGREDEMKQADIFYFFFPDAVCSRVRRGQFDVLEDLHVKRKAEATKAKNEPAPAVAKTSAVQFDLWGRDRPDRPS